MRRLWFLGVLVGFPFAAVPLVWAAADGTGSRDGACAFRERTVGCASQRVEAPESAAESRAARPVELFSATPRRIGVDVSAPAGVLAEVRDTSGRIVRRLGHFTIPARQRLLIAWNGRNDDGRKLRAGRYIAVATADGELGRDVARFRFAVVGGDSHRLSRMRPG